MPGIVREGGEEVGVVGRSGDTVLGVGGHCDGGVVFMWVFGGGASA